MVYWWYVLRFDHNAGWLNYAGTPNAKRLKGKRDADVALPRMLCVTDDQLATDTQRINWIKIIDSIRELRCCSFWQANDATQFKCRQSTVHTMHDGLGSNNCHHR